MSNLRDDVTEIAQKHIQQGRSLQYTVEYISLAMIELVPEDHPQRKAILEAPYAALAKILGRDASVYLQQKR